MSLQAGYPFLSLDLYLIYFSHCLLPSPHCYYLLPRWYVSDYSKAAPSNWGYGAGCDFFSLQCGQYMAKYPTQEFYCTKKGEFFRQPQVRLGPFS